MLATSRDPLITSRKLDVLPLVSIRQDGETQHRLCIDEDVVAEYAALMMDSVIFPPIRVWWDGNHYWLADGFHRAEAAHRAGLESFSAEICGGSLADARWDSYASNSSHGPRRTAKETKRVAQLALQHPEAAQRSNAELARHLNIPEPTLRRWRKISSSSHDEDGIRIVRRGGVSYRLATANIGKRAVAPLRKSRETLRAQLGIMREQGSSEARRALTIIWNWAYGSVTPDDCLAALENLLAPK